MSRFNFKDWNWKKLLQHNKGNIRLIISGVIGILTAYLSNMSAVWAVPLAGAVTGISKMVLDIVDYYISE